MSAVEHTEHRDRSEVSVTVSPVSFQRAQQAEEELVDRVAAGRVREALWVWRLPTCLVAPRSVVRSRDFDAASADSKSRGWPIEVRTTGGDLTPQHPGFFNLSYVFRPPVGGARNVHEAYRRLAEPIIAWLASDFRLAASTGAVQDSFCDGLHNITIDGLKLCGTAQRWLRRSSAGAGGEHVILGQAIVLAAGDLGACIDAVNVFRARTGAAERAIVERHTTLAATLADDAPPQAFAAESMRAFGRFLRTGWRVPSASIDREAA